MAATPLPPAVQGAPPQAVGNPGVVAPDGMPQPPGTDMTGICFRDQLWLNTYPLDRNLVFDYFALSPFYDWSCNNEQLRKMTGTEYALSEVMEPHLFVIRKQKRDGPEKVAPMLTYYILDGSIYQAPQLASVFASRIGRALYHISKAFTTAASKLEKIGYGIGLTDAENKESNSESITGKEAIDLKELKRVDHILATLQRKLPPAPPPPAFPEGYAPSMSEMEKELESQRASEQPTSVDPIIDQGPAKRTKF